MNQICRTRWLPAQKDQGSQHIYQHDERRALLVYHNLNETFGRKAIRQIMSSTS
jgi:predicted RNA binding protein YcfA (HicA-like mRNA interferase family)